MLKHAAKRPADRNRLARSNGIVLNGAPSDGTPKAKARKRAKPDQEDFVRLVPNTEYAKLIGVTTRTLYNYEAKGILSPPKRIRGRKYRDPREWPRFDD